MDNKLYNKDSIESLSPLEFTRLRPGVYCGDTTYSTQLLIEILSNAIDEYNLGHGNVIEIFCDNKNKIYRVKDYGQGFIPNSFREDKKTILEAAFSVLNTSGKYREDGTYEGTSLGSFGVGSKLTNFLSTQMEVTTYRDGEYETIQFVEGVFHNRQSGKVNKAFIDKFKGTHGTTVTWHPSEEFFTHNEVDMKIIKDLLETTVCLCTGLKIILTEDEKEPIIYYSERGLNDYVDKKLQDSEIVKNRLNIDYKNGKNKMNLVMTYSKAYSSTIVPYVNTGLTDSGPHITAFKTAITREFNKFFKEKKWLKEKDSNLTGDDIQEGLYLVFNLTTSGINYDAQVKSRITKIDTKDFIREFSEQLDYWLNTNEKEIKELADKAINARKAREAAKKARESVRKPKEKGLKAKMKLSNKFIDCVNKDPKERNLLLVEGVSAASSAVEARNAKTDAIYMLRGKIISPLKTDISKILQNQEMSDIIQIIGAGFGEDFDISKMSVDKIVITSDQDSDGASIELLLITFFYTYMRPLVLAGKLYRAITPLYIVTYDKNELYFYTEQEYSNWKKEHQEKSYSTLRCKGLGELSPIELHKVCFENQTFKQITVSDIQKAEELLEILEGKAVEPRKQYIYDNAENLGFNFD